MNELMYGNSPAAMYLARTIIEIGNPSYTRSVGKKITGTSESVNQLIDAVHNNVMSAKNAATFFRLMREEVTNSEYVGNFNNHQLGDIVLAEHLRRNVQIGYIKEGIRICTLTSKAERVMKNPKKRGNKEVLFSQNCYTFVDRQSGKKCYAGFEDDTQEYSVAHFQKDDFKTFELMEKSRQRCIRQGKEWTK